MKNTDAQLTLELKGTVSEGQILLPPNPYSLQEKLLKSEIFI